jgi:hypothetical protein
MILTPAYHRDDRAFFAHQSTAKAVAKLASSGDLVIYCGAGVTIDRTGKGWGDLIFDLLGSVVGTKSSYHMTEAEAIALRDKLSPLDLASVYEQYVLNGIESPKSSSVHDEAVPRIQKALYGQPAWESGELVPAIVALSLGLARLGTKVTVITSNYDSYLEQAFSDRRRKTTGVKGFPRLKVRWLGRQHLDEVDEADSGGSVELVYVHGSIKNVGKARGHLALTESDYHKVRPDVVAELTRAFEQSTLLILGSSLSDPPLLEALYATRDCPKRGERFALVPARSTGFASYGPHEFPRIATHLRERMKRYDLTMLVPDFSCQIAQFVLETSICAEMGSRYAEYADAHPKERYGQRLIGWWAEWNRGGLGGNPATLSAELAEKLKALRATWRSDEGETYKLELWVRHDPLNLRHISLWASSVGVLTDRDCLKSEDLDLATGNASVRAFVEGKPLWLAKEDLMDPSLRTEKRSWIEALDGRWTRYLVVPVRLSEPTMRIPVGVVTLAAFGGTGHTKGPTNLPINDTKAMASLVQELGNLGRKLLSVPT